VIGVAPPSTSKRSAEPGRSSNPDQGAPTNSTGRRPISGRSGQVLLRWFKSQAAQVGRFRESSFLTLARRSGCLHGRFMAPVVPRLVVRLLEFGLVSSPASLQSPASIVEGPEGCNYPARILRRNVWLSTPASCYWLAGLMLPSRPQEKFASGPTAVRAPGGDCRWPNGRNVLQHLALRRRCRVPSGRIRRRSPVAGTPIPRWAPFTGGKMPCITPP
jgi:hypothetical protein